MKTVLISFVLALAIAVFGVHWALTKQLSQENTWDTALPTFTPEAVGSPSPSLQPRPTADAAAALPEQASITVPYTVQAPKGVWDAVHEDACEEASLLMVYHFLSQTTFPSTDAADTEINAIIQYEEGIGLGTSITLQQLNSLAKSQYDMHGTVKEGVAVEDMKRELAAGRPIIAGFAGREMDNPHFTNGGPIYHMLVITGYDKDGFITNDPGTRYGEGYRYPFATLYGALHNWDAANIDNGGKSYLVFD